MTHPSVALLLCKSLFADLSALVTVSLCCVTWTANPISWTLVRYKLYTGKSFVKINDWRQRGHSAYIKHTSDMPLNATMTSKDAPFPFPSCKYNSNQKDVRTP
jgi:hypothetical protein